MRMLGKKAVWLFLVLAVAVTMLIPMPLYAEEVTGTSEQQTEGISSPGQSNDRSAAFEANKDGAVLVDSEVQHDQTVKIIEQKSAPLNSFGSSQSLRAVSDTVPRKMGKSKALRTAAAADASSHMHAAITTNNDTYESGTTAIVTVKYTLDQKAVHAGDYIIVTIPSSITAKVSFSLNRQHFSSSENLGDGQYKLIVADDIESGLSGSFNAYVTTAKVDKTAPGTISAGDARKVITVVPGGSPGGAGTYTDTIMKDGFENDGVHYGGYDYSEGYGDQAAQIGIADLTNGGTYKYRLYINDKQGDISNVTVIDRISDGMTLNRNKGVEVTDRITGKTVDASKYSVQYEGQTLIFKFPGTLSNTLQINYWVDIAQGSNTAKYTNTAVITYTQNGDTHQEHRSYVLQGEDNNAVNGEKSVDKTIISTDPDDQFVTYTIKFWNSNGFAAGEINLTDQLDPHVKFIGADTNDYFTVKQDEKDPQKIQITNAKAIDGSTTTYVRFITDMSQVPVGYTVQNTVGGNTTKTTKYGGGFTLSARKQIDGKEGTLKDGQFKFQLVDAHGKVLQTKKNDAKGDITFDRIAYKAEDVGKTFTYQMKEAAGNDELYDYDASVYTVTIVPQLEKDSNGSPTGKILVEPVIRKGSMTADAIVFNNTTRTGSLKLAKTSKGHDTPKDAEFTIAGPNGYSKTVKYSELKNGSITLSGLPIGTYTVKESKAEVDGYTLSVDGKTTAELTKGGTAEIALTNTYQPDKKPKTPTNKNKPANKNKPMNKYKTADKSRAAGAPQTGDGSNMTIWLILLVGAAALLAALLIRRRRK